MNELKKKTSRKWRYWALFSLFFLVGGGFWVARKIQKTSPSFQANTIQEKSREYESDPIKESDMVMVGTSLTAGFPPFTHFENIKNRGIKGDYSAHLLSRIGAIALQKPKCIFVEIGINDIGFLGLPPDSVLSNYVKILDRIQTLNPSTKVYVQSLLPLSENPSFSPLLSHKNPEVVKLNEELKKMCICKKVVYIDLHSSFLSNGELNPAYTVDGIHLNEKGYEVWASILSPFIYMNQTE
jgi:lysophospholipase L1-like esterase